jgi:hypothetical protein
MKKGVTILWGTLAAALMLTSFISAANSEIIVARNAALVVRSQPVLASDVSIQELGAEKYDSMIHSFQAGEDAAIPGSDQSSDPVGGSETAMKRVGPAVPDNEDDSVKSDNALHADDSENIMEAETAPEQETRNQPHAAAAAVDGNAIRQEGAGVPQNHTVYTVQAGSYTYRSNAENKYNSLIHDMNDRDRDHLRIEKIGEYYAVRLGRFDHYIAAKKFLNGMNSELSSAIVLKAYIKHERIVEPRNNALLAGK